MNFTKSIAEQLKELPLDACDQEDRTMVMDDRTITLNTVSIQRRIEDNDKVAPCNLCGRDIFHHIAVSWVVLWDGEKPIAGYRLCDDCYLRAKLEAKYKSPGPLKQGVPAIMRAIVILRVRNKVVKSPDQWKLLTTQAPPDLFTK